MRPIEHSDLQGLPGADLVGGGLSDLRAGDATENALLVLIAGPRLVGLGIAVPDSQVATRPYEHRLYELLEATYGDGAYSRYNSLIRRIVSFAHALEQLDSRSIRTGGPRAK